MVRLLAKTKNYVLAVQPICPFGEPFNNYHSRPCCFISHGQGLLSENSSEVLQLFMPHKDCSCLKVCRRSAQETDKHNKFQRHECATEMDEKRKEKLIQHLKNLKKIFIYVACLFLCYFLLFIGFSSTMSMYRVDLELRCVLYNARN